MAASWGASFGLRYRSTAPLGRRITGTYEGSLQRVVASLLDGYDFVVKTSTEGVEVVVYRAAGPGEASPATKAVQGTAPSAQKSSTAQTRREERRKRHTN